MPIRILLKVGQGQLEERAGRTQPTFLQMHKRAGQLDQPFVKQIVSLATLSQPKLLQNVVGFVEAAAIETIQVAEVMAIQVSSFEGGHQGRDSSRFVAHRQSLAVFQGFVQPTSAAPGKARPTWEPAPALHVLLW